MKHPRRSTHRLIRALVLAAAFSALTLALAGSAIASDGPNYGNFNPLTGKPYGAPGVTLKYGDFNPLTGRPNGAPQATGDATRVVGIGATTEPAAPTARTVVKEHGGQTLAISLAAAAFLITLAGTGYMVVRTSGLPRPARGR